MRRNISDNALEELESLTNRIEVLQNQIHERIVYLYNGNQKILVRHKIINEESCLEITLINLNREIAHYIYKTSSNNLFRLKSDINKINSNRQHEPVVEYLNRLEKVLEIEYDLLVVIND